MVLKVHFVHYVILEVIVYLPFIEVHDIIAIPPISSSEDTTATVIHLFLLALISFNVA